MESHDLARKVCAMFAACFAFASVAQAKDALTSNCVQNAGLEAPLDASGQPPGFKITTTTSADKGRTTWALSSDAHSGKQCLRLTRTNSEAGACMYVKLPEWETAEGERRKFIFTWWVKRLQEGGKIRLRPQLFNRAWSGATRTCRRVGSPSWATSWVKEGLLAEMPPRSNLVRVRWLISTRAPNSSILLDDVSFCDATNWPAAKINQALAESPVSLPKTEIDALPLVKGNILLNSSFELGLAGGWSVPGPVPQEQAQAATELQARFGRGSLCLDLGRGLRRLASRFYVIRPKQTHTLSCWAKASRPGLALRLAIDSGYVSDAGRVQGVSKRFAVDTQWRRLSVSGVLLPAPAHAYYVSARVEGKEPGRVWIDAMQLEEGQATRYQPARAVAGALRTSHWPSNLYTWNERPEVRATLVNQSERPAASRLSWRIVDFWDNTVGSGPLSAELAPKERRVFPVALPPSLRGSFHLLVEDGARIVFETTLTVVPPPRHAGLCRASRFGGHMGYAQYADRIAKRLGVNWMRHHDCTTFTSWDVVEPEPGRWVWHDKEIDALRAMGIEILGVYGRVPPWQMSDADRKRMPKGGWARFTSMDAWRQYVLEVTRHYRGRIDSWEVWNEPYGFAVNNDAAFYTQLCKAAFQAAKEANPNVMIVGLCTGAASTKFNDYFFSHRGAGACDAISFHHYTTDLYEKQSRSAARGARAMMQVIRDAGAGDHPLWMTEGGQGYIGSWHKSLPPNAVDDFYSRRMAPVGAVPSQLAARCWARYVPMMLAEGVEKIFHYWEPWQDGGGNASRPDRFTWFEYDGSLKPYAAAYAAAAYFLDDTRPAAAPPMPKGVCVRAFERGEEMPLTLWTDEDAPIDVRVDAIPGFGAAFDMFGGPITVQGGVLQVGHDVIYVLCRAVR